MLELQPYIGPRPFERDDADKLRFFGRDAEARDLLSRIVAHPTLLFYSPSGAGKTSLINAKLIPMLEKEGFSALTPGRVRNPTPSDIDFGEIENIYVFNALRSWDENRTESRLLTQLSIADYLKQTALPTKEGDRSSPRVAIFDQFEEMFTFNSERWEDRQDFFEQISHTLDEDRLLRVVFIIREDYIAELDPYLHLLPEKLRTRYRLERLDEEKALMAVTGPLKHTNCTFADGVAEQLVSNLLMIPVETTSGVKKVKGEFVEPVQLQVVCQALWENSQASWNGSPASGRRVITSEQLAAFGNVDQALSEFYERTIEKVVGATGLSEGKLRDWFERKLITPVGTRGTIYRGLEESGGIIASAVDALVSHHLIVSESRGGARWIELAHDRLIEPIKASNENWRLRHSGDEQVRRLLEDKAIKWTQAGRKSNNLLDEGGLLEAERWLDSPYASDVTYSDALLALVNASKAAIEEAARRREEALSKEQRLRAEEQTKGARRLRWLIVALTVMFIFALGAMALAFHQKKLAETNAQRAEASAKEASDARRADQEKLSRINDAIRSREKAAFNYRQQGKLDEALKTYDALAESYEQIGATDSQAQMLTQAAKIAVDLKKPADAFSRFNQAAEIYDASAKTHHAQGELEKEADSLTYGAEIRQGQGRLDEAIERLKEAVGIYHRIGGLVGSVNEAKTLVLIGTIYKTQERFDDALTSLNDAAKIHPALGAIKGSPNEAENLVLFAEIYEAQGKPEEALSRLMEAARIYHENSRTKDEDATRAQIQRIRDKRDKPSVR